MMKKELNNMLACPKCKNYPLELKIFDRKNTEIINGELKCTGCSSVYPIIDGVPRMIFQELSDKWKILQDEYIDWIRKSGKERISRHTQAILKDFVKSLNIDGGKLLDIGSGDNFVGTILSNTEYYGVDPYIRSQIHPYPFIVAYGEYLPFRDEVFDYVIIRATLDHVEDAAKVISEANRVLKTDGFLCISQSVQECEGFKKKAKNLFYMFYEDGINAFTELAEHLKGLLVKSKGKGHIREYTKETLLSEFNSHNFEVIDVLVREEMYLKLRKVRGRGNERKI